MHRYSLVATERDVTNFSRILLHPSFSAFKVKNEVRCFEVKEKIDLIFYVSVMTIEKTNPKKLDASLCTMTVSTLHFGIRHSL